MELINHHDQLRRDQAMQFLGGAYAMDRLKEHLSSQVIAALMTIEEQKLYLDYGYKKFDLFLSGSDLSPMSKSQFYRLRELYLKEGPEQYDLFTAWKVPLSTRRLLTSGDIVVEGDEVVIAGEERVSLANSGSIKAIIEQLVKEKTSAVRGESEAIEQHDKKANKLKDIEKKYGDLCRDIEAQDELPPMAQAYMNATKAMLVLIGEVKALDSEEQIDRADGDLNYWAELWQQLHEAYGVYFDYKRRTK